MITLLAYVRDKRKIQILILVVNRMDASDFEGQTSFFVAISV
jgi:hypothetical protein